MRLPILDVIDGETYDYINAEGGVVSMDDEGLYISIYLPSAELIITRSKEDRMTITVIRSGIIDPDRTGPRRTFTRRVYAEITRDELISRIIAEAAAGTMP